MMSDDGYRRVQGRGREVIRELIKPIVDEYRVFFISPFK